MKTNLCRWICPVLLGFLAVLAPACRQAEAPSAPLPGETIQPGGVPTATPDSIAGEIGGYYDRAMGGEFAGRTVTIAGLFSEEDAAKFLESVAEFEGKTEIDIQYEGSLEFIETLTERVESGQAPDLFDFPQPGSLAGFVESGKIVNVFDYLDPAYLEEQYSHSWLEMATYEGPEGSIMAGVWHHYNAKSLVWYPKDDFDAAGYEPPETWGELIALSDQMVADGRTPWCLGIESDLATGWIATDWIEEIMLRTTSLENYDAWVRGDLPFQSAEVRQAGQIMSDIFLRDGYVLGGQTGLLITPALYAASPMFENPPACWLHKQGNFITSFFPEGVKAGLDYDFFYLPPIDVAYGRPFLVGGDMMVQFNDRPEVRAVMEFFTRGESVKAWLELGGTLSPHRDARLDWYGDEVERGIAILAAEATSFRFDGSDLMPAEVGAGSFWAAMTDYLSGVISLDEALAEIDASWPE